MSEKLLTSDVGQRGKRGVDQLPHTVLKFRGIFQVLEGLWKIKLGHQRYLEAERSHVDCGASYRLWVIISRSSV